MANGAFKFKDNSGNVVSYISGSGPNIAFSGGTLDLSGMTGLTLGGLTISGSIQNAQTASSAPSYLLTSSFNTYSSSLATTGSNLFKGNQTISGSIIPAVTNTYDLGSPTNNFRDIYLSSASLYIDGTKVLGSTAQELQITTDTGQSFKILEAGSDTITLQSADGNITLTSSGGGDVIMDPTNGIIALKGTTTVYSGHKIVSSDGNSIQFGNGIAVTGSIVSTVTPLVSGSSQISYTGLSNIPSGIISSSTQLPSGIVSSSLQVTGYGFSTTGSNVFVGSQVITGSLYITTDLVVQGCSSLQNITASAVSIGTNTVMLNTATPAVRFAGISVQDSGSNAGVTGSIFWDGLCNRWIYSNPSTVGYSGGMLLSGPRNLTTIGEESTLSCNYLAKSGGGDHLYDSCIQEVSGSVTIGGTLCSSGVVCGASIISNGIVTGNDFYNGISYPYNTNFGSGADASTTTIRAGSTNGYQSCITLQGAGCIIINTSSNQRVNITSTGIACFSCQICAPSFIGGTLIATTIYGSTTVCSPVGYFSGCVGIGTSSPNTLLSLVGNHVSGQGILKVQSATAYSSAGIASIGFNDFDNVRKAIIYSGTDGLQLETGTSIPILFKPAGVTKMTIDASGNVNFACNITLTSGYIDMPWASDTRTIWERCYSASYFQKISTNGTARQLRLESNGAYGNASIVLDGQSNTTVTTTITSDITHVSGKLGIGTCSPNSTLQIVNSQINTGIYNTNLSGDYISMIPFQRGNGSDFFGLSRNGQMSIFASPSCSNVFSIGTQNASDMIFGTNDVARMRITSTGGACFACPISVPRVFERPDSLTMTCNMTGFRSMNIAHMGSAAYFDINPINLFGLPMQGGMFFIQITTWQNRYEYGIINWRDTGSNVPIVSVTYTTISCNVGTSSQIQICPTIPNGGPGGDNILRIYICNMHSNGHGYSGMMYAVS